ncbi:phage/plasmid primase, P4 family [Oerskovia jenensis]|uniref:phage/plasmid primase, P4 family n=1 Tax=Oerskovia jenensis TaxID=162169 RepID=UPI0036DAB860
MTPDILAAALELAAAGYSILPIRDDHTKSPALPAWKPYQATAADEHQVRTWFTGTTHGLAVVQGFVSGGAELAELEGRAAHHLPALRQLAHDTGLGNLWDAVATGWTEMSPSGGFHFHYRVDGPVPGNTKLARRPSTPEELTAWKHVETTKAHNLAEPVHARRLDKIAATTAADVPQVLAETRGEAGYVVVAPTPGTHHDIGRPWVRVAGGPTTTPVLTLEERDAFLTLLRTLDEMPARHEYTPPTAPAVPHDPTAGITPGDDYENRTDWADILTLHGWTLASARGRTRFWTRPGKTFGISATTGHADDRDRLYVFTSSTDFEPDVPYTKLGALAVLEHDGDHAAAATELHRRGFGQRAIHLRPVPDGPPPGGDLAGLIAPTDGTAALAPAPVARPALHVVEPVAYTETDDGNALRLVDTHHHTIRYVPQRAQWLTWDGARWRWDDAGHVTELARSIARDLPEDDKQAERHRRTSLSKRGIESMVALSRSDARTVTHLRDLDARPYELNTPTGVINLRTGTLSQPDPAALHTRSTTAAPDFDAPHPQWDRFLADTFAGDPTMTTYVQRLFGVSLVGLILEQLLPFAHGAGANGKTTLAGTVQRIVGVGDDGYSLNAPAELLLATRNQAHPTEIARLAGARLVFTSELEDGQAFAEAKVKMLTGKDTISGRFMGKDWFSFTPTHSLWLLANHQPAVRSGGPAFWRRVRMLGFEHTVPPEQRVTDLEDRLVDEEGPAILAWLVRGAAEYFTLGLQTPAAVLAATNAYERDTDTVGRFVEDRCATGDPNAQHMQAKVSEVRAAYEHWCRTEDETAVSPKTFTQQLTGRFGVRSTRSMSARYYSGIHLVDVSSDEDEPVLANRTLDDREGW